MILSIEICTVLAETIIAAYLFEHLFKRRENIYYTILYYIIYAVVIATSTFIIPMAAIRVVFLTASSLIGNYIIYRPHILSCVYITVLYYITVVLSDVIGGYILSLNNISLDFAIGGTERAIYNATAKLINLILVQLILVIFRNTNWNRMPFSSVILLFCHVFSTYTCFHCFFALFTSDQYTLFLLITLCLLTVNIIICIFVGVLQRYYDKQNAAIAASQQKEVQLRYYKEMLVHQEETRALWHDIKKYFMLLTSLFEAGQTSEASTYFQELQLKFDQINKSVDFGNPVIDSIISYELTLAANIDTKLELDIWIDHNLDISSADLFIIIGNTMENALDACALLPKEQRKIHLILHQTNHLLYYELSNPYIDTKKPKPGKVHGYGLKNVQSCVDKNLGTLKIDTQNSVFTVRIQLNV